MHYPLIYGCQWADLNLIHISFQILNSLCCLPFKWTFIHDMLLLSVFFSHCWFHYIKQQFSSIYVVFESTLLNYANPCRNWTFQRFRKGSTEERTQWNRWKIWHSLRLEPRSSAILAPMLYPLSCGCPWADLNLIHIRFQIEIHSDAFPSSGLLFTTCCYLVFFLIIVHSWFHYKKQQFSSIFVVFESTLLNYANPCRNWTCII